MFAMKEPAGLENAIEGLRAKIKLLEGGSAAPQTAAQAGVTVPLRWMFHRGYAMFLRGRVLLGSGYPS